MDGLCCIYINNFPWHKVEVIAENETRVWAAGLAYIVGDVVAYPDAASEQYECIQAHTSQEGWTPSAMPALWKVRVDGEEAG